VASNVPAVSSAVRVIERLASEWPDPMLPRELIDELGMNRSTCYNILSTLQNAGWVRALGDRTGWTLGPRLLTLTGVSSTMALGVMQEEIDELSRRLGFVVFVAERDGSGGYVVVAKAERRLGVRVTVGVGEYFDFSAPALMYAFHGWGSEKAFDDAVERYGVKAFTENTLTEPDDMRAELVRTRERGYSISLQQFDLAQGGAAAPVFDPHGQVACVVATIAFASELNESTVAQVGELVASSARRITENLGGRDAATRG
jgi:DNA-binding IclR family transcriptional regulator